MGNYNLEELIKENEELKKQIHELSEQKDAFIKKSEYLSKELQKKEKGNGHLSTMEIVTDLALMLCAALLFTIISYVSGAYGEGFFEVIKNAFAWIF